MNNGVPVIMYHSVGRVLPEWDWAILTIPWETFEEQLAAMKRAGYRTVDLEQLRAHVSGEKPLPPRSVVLTFDDGYVDNWTFAYPLLKKYGMTGTVVVSPEFVDPRDMVRPTLEDVWAGRTRADDLEAHGYMTWPELEQASGEGVLSVQSHALTHTWYATGPDVVDFHRPGDNHYWLDWNANPAEKPFYMQRLGESSVPWGVPVYAHAKSLECRRYFTDPDEANHLASFVASSGGAAFFDAPDWRSRIRTELDAWRDTHGVRGDYESDEARRERLHRELADSKRIIEDRLGKEVHSMFWPGGGHDDLSMEIARSIYRGVTVSSKERWRLINAPGQDPALISRRGVPFVDTARWRAYTGGRYFVEFLEEQQGSSSARKLRQVRKLMYLLGARVGMWPVGTIQRIPLPRDLQHT